MKDLTDLTDTKLYYINLNTRKDRKVQFEAQAALCAMPPIERIPAVHGLSLDITNDKQIGLHTRVQVTTEFRRSHYEIHSRGAVGASFSHIKAWKTFLANGSKYALIMEDDVNLPPTFAMMVRDCMKTLPDKWDIWIMGWNHNPSDLNTKGPLPHIREVLHFTGAHCYIVSRNAAKKLVEEAFPIESHVEHFMSNVAFMHSLKVIRDVRLHMPQMDRVLTVSDVRKPEGCPACVLDDKDEAIAARIANA
jgi:glycosyl transferase family 25